MSQLGRIHVHVDVHTAVVDGTTEITFYVLHKERIIGKLTATDWQKQGVWLTWLHVSEAFRKHGVGRELLRAAIDYAKAHKKTGIGLSVLKDNLVAQYLYLMHDFVVCYEAGNNLVMTRHIVHRNSFLTPQDLAAELKKKLVAEEATES